MLDLLPHDADLDAIDDAISRLSGEHPTRATSTDLDRSLLETIRIVGATSSVRPDQTFVARLDRVLLPNWPAPPGSMRSAPRWRTGANQPTVPDVARPSNAQSASRSWVATNMSLIALLVLLAAGVWRTTWSAGDRPTSIVEISALVAGPVPTTGTATVDIQRVFLEPGAVYLSRSVGTSVVVVEQGMVVLGALVDQDSVALDAGAMTRSEAGSALRVENRGDVPAQVLVASIDPGGNIESVSSNGKGVDVRRLHVGYFGEDAPRGVRLVMRRFKLRPDDVSEPLAGRAWVLADEPGLRMTAAPDESIDLVEITSTRVMTRPSMRFDVEPAWTATLQNVGTDTITVTTIAIEPLVPGTEALASQTELVEP